MRAPFLFATAGLVATVLAGHGPARADGVTSYQVESSFDDVAFALESAIIGQGLVIDHISQVGEMLNRTAADVGAERQIYLAADVYQFCSAVLSRKMMEANPDNIAHCPYSVFIYELAEHAGVIHVGYRRVPPGEMQEVEALLDEIVRETVGVD